MRNKIKKIDKQLLLLTIILFSYGLVMIYSASNVTAFYVYDVSSGRFFLRQGIVLIVGIILFTILMKINTKKYYKLASTACILLTGMIAFLVMYGTATNGSKNWITILGFTFQPSEFIKVAIIPFMAMFYEKYEKYEDGNKMYYPLILSIIIFALIILQNDYGTAFIFITLAFGLFFFSTASKRIKASVASLGVIAVVALILIISSGALPKSKLTRLKSNINPCKIENYLNEGNQLCNSYIAINGGGIFGKGLGNSTQKYLYLSESHTDYIFAIVVEELGAVGGIVLIGLYFLTLVEIIKVGKRCKKNSHSMICYGTAIYLFLHMAINLSGVLGIIPLTGIPLPFMSYGGSFALSIIIALSMVQRINFETKS